MGVCGEEERMDSMLRAFRTALGADGCAATVALAGGLVVSTRDDLSIAAFTDASMLTSLGRRVGGICSSSCIMFICKVVSGEKIVGSLPTCGQKLGS